MILARKNSLKSTHLDHSYLKYTLVTNIKFLWHSLLELYYSNCSSRLLKWPETKVLPTIGIFATLSHLWIGIHTKAFNFCNLSDRSFCRCSRPLNAFENTLCSKAATRSNSLSIYATFLLWYLLNKRAVNWQAINVNFHQDRSSFWIEMAMIHSFVHIDQRPIGAAV